MQDIQTSAGVKWKSLNDVDELRIHLIDRNIITEAEAKQFLTVYDLTAAMLDFEQYTEESVDPEGMSYIKGRPIITEAMKTLYSEVLLIGRMYRSMSREF